jgi:hypothetical protein
MRTLYEGINDQLAAGDGSGWCAGNSLSGSAALPQFDSAGVNSGFVNNFGASLGTPGAFDDIAATLAPAQIASLKQLMTPSALRDLPSGNLAPDGLSVPLLDSTKATSNNASITLTGGARRDLFLDRLDPDSSAWNALTKTLGML